MKGNAYIPFMRSRGDGSTLNLDFTKMSALDSRFTFTRSTTATYIDSSGYVASAAINEARFECDATTLAAKGLLIEGSATNAALYSESFVTSGGVYSDNAILSRTTTETSPSGGTAICFFPTIVLDYHRLQYSNVPVLSGAVTISIWLKRKDSNYRGGINAVNYLGVSAVFDLNGAGSVVTLGGTATNKAATITAYPNNWYRISVTGTYVAGSSVYTFITSSTSTDSTGQNFTGVASQGLIMWGMQIELGNVASSYIPTTTAQVTRNPDLALMTSTNFSSWFTGGTTGTFFVDWHGGVRGLTSTVRTVISTNDQTTKHLHLQQASAAGVLKVADFGAAHSVSTANSITSGARTKGAFNFDGATTTVNLCLNGGTVATSSAIAFSVAPTWLALGATSTDGSTLTDLTTVLNGSIRQIKYYPTALTSAQLIAMTT